MLGLNAIQAPMHGKQAKTSGKFFLDTYQRERKTSSRLAAKRSSAALVQGSLMAAG
jgi:hypothetical protein